MNTGASMKVRARREAMAAENSPLPIPPAIACVAACGPWEVAAQCTQLVGLRRGGYGEDRLLGRVDGGRGATCDLIATADRLSDPPPGNVP